MSDLKSYLDNKNYDEAIKFLNSNNTFEKPIKFYNLGYVYTLKGDFVQARFYLEKAKAEGLINEKVENSLKLVKSKLGVEQVESDYPVIDKSILSISHYKEDVFLTVLGLVLMIFLYGIFRKKRIIATISVIVFLSLGSFLYVIKDFKTVIVKEEVFVHQGPSRIFEPNQMIMPGAKVVIDGEARDWKYVKYPEVYRGWIYKSKVKKL